jgi:hypothetical protein
MLLKVFATIFKTISLLLIAVLLTPLAFFAWRAGQPLDRPDFRGLSYIELMTDRQAAYDQLAASYQASHPDVDVKDGMCFSVEAFVEVIMSWPGSGFYTLAGAYPELKRYVNPLDLARGYVPEGVTARTFLPTWWETFELFVWHLIDHVPHGPVAYCRIPVP